MSGGEARAFSTAGGVKTWERMKAHEGIEPL
jgi:hypothetical protein